MSTQPSVYKQKLELLVAGYAKENIPKWKWMTMPIALLKQIEIWHSNAPKLILNIGAPNKQCIECYLDEDCNKLLNINRYKVSYTVSCDGHETINDHLIFKPFQQESQHFIGMTGIKHPWDRGLLHYKLECVALDEKDNILIQSQPVSCDALNFRLRYVGTDIGSKKFPFQLFDVSNNGFITLNEWISGLKRLEIDITELGGKRVFYFLAAGKSSDDEQQPLSIHSEDIQNLLKYSRNWEMEGYDEIVNKLIAFKNNYETNVE